MLFQESRAPDNAPDEVTALRGESTRKGEYVQL